MKESKTIDRSTILYRVHNTLSRIHDLAEHDDLRRWSPKARRSLRLAGNITLVVSTSRTQITEEVTTYTVPKLAIMVASPPIRELIVKDPEVQEIELIDGNFESGAVGVLCYWLTSICDWSAQAVPYLPCPDDLIQALQLRHAAQLLYMDKYVKSFAVRYHLGLQYRAPSTIEAIAISVYTLDSKDEVLNAWASRVVQLRRSDCLTSTYLGELADVLVLEGNHKMSRALYEADTLIVYPKT